MLRERTGPAVPGKRTGSRTGYISWQTGEERREESLHTDTVWGTIINKTHDMTTLLTSDYIQH